jgi:hypothetical protein
MPDLDPAPENAETMHGHDDEEELAEAYEALEEDRRRQAQLAAAAPISVPVQPIQSEPAVETASEPTPEEPNISGSGESPAQETTDPAPQSGRRVFVIDGKEYPDPDCNLPITGTRSVQAMYRDYFAGQLDNADVGSGTLSVLIGTDRGPPCRSTRT